MLFITLAKAAAGCERSEKIKEKIKKKFKKSCGKIFTKIKTCCILNQANHTLIILEVDSQRTFMIENDGQLAFKESYDERKV